MNVIFNYPRSFCQISIALVATFFLNSCAGKRDAASQIPAMEIKPVYNGLQPKAAELKPDGTYSSHLFFDPAPLGHPDDRSVNVVVVTPANSKQSYSLDTRSGAVFRSHYNCKHDDIWGKFDDTLSLPPFSVAVVPRMLDALGKPQEAFVFGASEFWGKRLEQYDQAYRVRVVGGVIRQVCRDYPCMTREKWLSNMQLIAVNVNDPKFANVLTLEELKSKVDWEEALAWMQNGFGATLAGTRPEPVYRITGEIDANRALGYFLKKNRQIEFEEQKSMVNGCMALYDRLWEGALNVRTAVGEKREAIKAGKTGTDALLIEYSDLERINLTREQRQADFTNKRLDQRKRDQEADFARFFGEFHDKYGKRYKTCMRFVRPASLVKDSNRFWFFAYVDLFMWLEELGWSYRCSRKAWLENPRRSDGKRTFEDTLEKNCTTEELDMAFDMAVTVMGGEKTAKRPFVRFLGYDSGFGGSHQKVYGWVYDDGKELVCKDSDEVKLLESDRETVFPSDINWVPFKIEKRRSRYDIIQ